MKATQFAVGALLVAAAVAAVWAWRSGAVRQAPASVAGRTAKMVLPFIEDDYTKALAEARARKLPLFVENWAPW